MSGKISFWAIILMVCFSISVFSQKSSVKTGTIKSVDNFSELEKEINEEINNVRKNPPKYIEYLEDYKKVLKEKVLYRPNQMPFQMKEGAASIDNAIAHLRNLQSIAPLKTSEMLTIVANNQLKDLQENPKLGHYGKDGSDLRKRLAKVGKSGKNASENINYRDKIARQAVLTMIIDDGVKSRTHRKNILNPLFNLLGVSCGIAVDKRMICVLVFADTFEEIKPSKNTVPVEIL